MVKNFRLENPTTVMFSQLVSFSDLCIGRADVSTIIQGKKSAMCIFLVQTTKLLVQTTT